MTLDDLERRIHTLTTPGEVDAFLQARPRAALLKLGSCHKNVVALREVEAQLGAREDLELGLIRVIESRPASNHVESRTGIVHESPQLILFVAGRAVFDRDNWDITAESIAEGLERLDREPIASGALAAAELASQD